MNVVVGQTMADEQRTMQVVGTGDGVNLVVAAGILLRCTHVTLGIDGVVITPAGRRRDGHTGTEHRATLGHRHEGVPATIAPTPDADTILIYITLITQPKGCLYLVASLELAQAQVGTLLEFGTTTAGTTVINAHADITLLTQILLEDGTIASHAQAPLVEHLLRARTAVLIHDDGILLGGIEVGGLNHITVQLHALAGGKSKHLLLTQLVIGQLCLELVVVDKCGELFAVVLADGVLGGIVDIAPDIDKVLELNLWEGDKVFLKLLNAENDFFSVKLIYDCDDNLIDYIIE